MAGVNKVILLGNLGADPEVKHLEGDNVVANLRLATTESYKDKMGNRVDNTEWHDLELWGGQARIAEQYLKKGMQIFVEGKIKSDTWQDEQGNNRKKTRIRVLSFTMLGGKGDTPGGGGAPSQNPNSMQQQPHQSASMPNNSGNIDESDDDLPF
jgi:single-strand DNA-binding protein